MKKPSREELETMRDARAASLIKRWLAGKKLTDTEKAEIAHVIPLEILNLGPHSPGAKEAVSKIGQCGSHQSTRKHVKYKQKLPYYASVFGQTDRTIKRWMRRGKELPPPTRNGELDVPPLDDPPKMAAWWRRCMDRQVPDYILAIADPHAGNGDASPPTTDEADSTAGQSGPDRSPRDFSGVQGLGLAENVAALRVTHAINKKLLDEALHADPPNDSATQLRQKNFERSFNLLRVAEITLVEFQEKHGQLVNEASVRAELAQLLESLRLMRETMPRRILNELEKILPRRFQRILAKLAVFLIPAIEKARASEIGRA